MTNDPMTIPSSLGPYHLFTDVCVGLLNQGQSVRFKANGWSMHPTICDGEMINVEPVLPSQVRHGDIILYRSPRGITAHRVIHIQEEMEPHGQASYPIQPPMWGEIPVRSWRIPSSAGAESVLSPHSSLLRFYTRGDSLEATDPPLTADQILGKVFSVERNGRIVALYGNRAIILQEMRLILWCLKQYVVYVMGVMKGFFLQYDSLLKNSFFPGFSKKSRCEASETPRSEAPRPQGGASSRLAREAYLEVRCNDEG